MKILTTALLCLILIPLCASAEEKNARKEKWDNLHSFEKQAHQYTRRSRISARQAKNSQDPYLKERLEKLSKNLSFMADCKRKALEAEKKGKKYNWSAYENTKGESAKLQQEINQHKARVKKEKNVKPTVAAKKKLPQPTTEVANETAEKPDLPKTFKTADGFMIRTSL